MDDIKEEDVIGFDALYESMQKCRKGVLWKDSVAAYYLRSIERTVRLSKELQDGSYKASPMKNFKITHPKPRDIASVTFRDRVYQRSLNDHIVYLKMVRGFIYDNYACQQRKGTDAARDRLKQFLRTQYRNDRVNGYVAQLDIKGYYPNMRHDVAESQFQKHLPEWAFDRVVSILRNQYPGSTGYNPGSQLVQIAGISVLDPIDHYIKERLHIHLYIRYMDDMILIHSDRKYLEQCFQKITRKLNEIGFELNERKSKIFQIKDGVEFLGFRFYLTDSGKVLMQIDPKKVKEQRRKLKKLVRKAKNGELQKESVDASYEAWKAHVKKGNSYHLLVKMDKYYHSLWKDGVSNA